MDARSKTIIAVSSVLGFLATVAVALRLWARRIKPQKFGFDDILIFVALALTLGVVGNNIVGAAWARVGEHEIVSPSGPDAGDPLRWEIRRDSITNWCMEILHTCAMPAIKAYTLVFYLRIFQFQGFRIAIFVVGGYVFCWWVAVLVTTIFQCIPVGPVATLKSKCIHVVPFFQAAAVLNVLSDFVIIIMPLPVLATLNMPLRHKIAVAGIFLTSSIVVVAGIGRTRAYFHLAKDLDYSYHDYLVFVWTSVEPCMGIIGACLPSIRPIFRGFSPESLVGSIRSAFSLHSIGSRNNMRRDGVKLDDSHPLRKTSEDGDVSSKNFGIANVQKPAPSYQVTQDFELHSLDETK